MTKVKTREAKVRAKWEDPRLKKKQLIPHITKVISGNQLLILECGNVYPLSSGKLFTFQIKYLATTLIDLLFFHIEIRSQQVSVSGSLTLNPSVLFRTTCIRKYQGKTPGRKLEYPVLQLPEHRDLLSKIYSR